MSFFATLDLIKDLDVKIKYYSIEKFLFPKYLIEEYYKKFPFLEDELNWFLNTYSEKSEKSIQEFNFKDKLNLFLVNKDVNSAIDKIKIKTDIWFLDGFDPKKNPEMWSEKIFEYIKNYSKPNATLTTYSVSKSVKDPLKKAGFEIKKLKGFGKKREMLFAKFNSNKFFLKDKPWFMYPKILSNKKQISIIGSGLAGANLAYQFSNAGFEVHVFEKESEISSKASSNPCALFVPQIYKKNSFESIWYKKAFFELEKLLKNIPSEIYEVLGAREILQNKNLYLENKSDEIDFSKYDNSVFFNNAGFLYPKELNQFLLSKKNIQLHLNQKIDQFDKKNDRWILFENKKPIFETEILILANSYFSNEFPISKIDELVSTRGQVLIFERNTNEILIEEDFYLTKFNDKFSLIGSTFNPEEKSEEILEKDNQILEKRFLKKFPNEKIPINNRNSWFGFRASSKDHLPILGLIPNFNICNKIYSEIWKGNQYQEFPTPIYHENLFILSGLGSKGILNSVLGAKLILNLILNNDDFPKEFYDKTNPIRFLKQKLARNEH